MFPSAVLLLLGVFEIKDAKGLTLDGLGEVRNGHINKINCRGLQAADTAQWELFLDRPRPIHFTEPPNYFSLGRCPPRSKGDCQAGNLSSFYIVSRPLDTESVLTINLTLDGSSHNFLRGATLKCKTDTLTANLGLSFQSLDMGPCVDDGGGRPVAVVMTKQLTTFYCRGLLAEDFVSWGFDGDRNNGKFDIYLGRCYPLQDKCTSDYDYVTISRPLYSESLLTLDARLMSPWLIEYLYTAHLRCYLRSFFPADYSICPIKIITLRPCINTGGSKLVANISPQRANRFFCSAVRPNDTIYWELIGPGGERTSLGVCPPLPDRCHSGGIGGLFSPNRSSSTESVLIVDITQLGLRPLATKVLSQGTLMCRTSETNSAVCKNNIGSGLGPCVNESGPAPLAAVRIVRINQTNRFYCSGLVASDTVWWFLVEKQASESKHHVFVAACYPLPDICVEAHGDFFPTRPTNEESVLSFTYYFMNRDFTTTLVCITNRQPSMVMGSCLLDERGLTISPCVNDGSPLPVALIKIKQTSRFYCRGLEASQTVQWFLANQTQRQNIFLGVCHPRPATCDQGRLPEFTVTRDSDSETMLAIKYTSAEPAQENAHGKTLICQATDDVRGPMVACKIAIITGSMTLNPQSGEVLNKQAKTFNCSGIPASDTVEWRFSPENPEEKGLLLGICPPPQQEQCQHSLLGALYLASRPTSTVSFMTIDLRNLSKDDFLSIPTGSLLCKSNDNNLASIQLVLYWEHPQTEASKSGGASLVEEYGHRTCIILLCFIIGRLLPRNLGAALASLALLTAAHCWINEYDQPVHYQCPTGQFLSHVNSQHDNRYEDRVWDFECRALPVAEAEIVGCHWTNYVNEFDLPVTYQCPGEGFITGIESVHDNGHEDRRFKYQCCEAQGAITHGCFFTDWENDWDGILDYIVPAGKVMRGMDSYHDNGKEDRRFKFEICDLEGRTIVG